MSKIFDIWYMLSYKLENHYLGPISLRNWLWAWVLVPPALAVAGRLSWWGVLPLSLGGMVLWIGSEVAKRHRYLRFTPTRIALDAVSQSPIVVDELVPVWASGEFAVGDGRRLMLNEPAFYTFVRTREHILMVHLKRTRFLLLARSRQIEVGWWYVFFKPERLLSVQPGRIANGLRAYLGLALTWYPEGCSSATTVYVGCDQAHTLKRILDDLRRDAPAQAFGAL